MNSQTIDDAERRFFEKIQLLLASEKLECVAKTRKRQLKIICGADAAYSAEGEVVAVASCFSSKSGQLLEQYEYRGRATFPYVSGLFYLREGPFVCEAISRLATKPDLVCFDAHGMAHPRSLGLATICGMILGIPSMGIAKSILAGACQPYKPGLGKLFDKDKMELVGFVTSLQNKKRYWSPGYSISIHQLERIISEYGPICLKSIAESHTLATTSLKR